MKTGTRYKAGEVILVRVQFTDTYEIKQRPAVILYTELGNLVVAGITSNKNMMGIPLSQKEGMIKDSIIKTNYIFTIAPELIKKKLVSLSDEKKTMLMDVMQEHITQLSQ